MAWGSVRLLPGVNVERTPTLLEAAVSSSQLIRYRDGLVQKLGGWTTFFSAATGVPRDLHAWLDLNGVSHVGIGSTTRLSVVTSNIQTDITPQTMSSNVSTANFSELAASILITDNNISTVTINDAVFLNTPVLVNGTILATGLYRIVAVTGLHSYAIHQGQDFGGIGGTGAVPTFTTISGSATVTVNMTNCNAQSGGTAWFFVSTTGNGVTIFGSYQIQTGGTSTFTITANTAASGSSTFAMNSNQAQLVYYLGQDASGLGQTGTKISATDWTSDNWGEIWLACPAGGAVYQFDPTSGNQNAFVIFTAPPFNTGIFISQTQQVLVCYGSTPTVPEPSNLNGTYTLPRTYPFGAGQDPLLVRWSSVGDFTNFVPTATNQAGSFRIPVGSKIVAGAAVSNQNLIWTDIDLWAMNYIGLPFVYGFNKIGAGAGAVSSHSIQQLRGNVYWMGTSNFYSYTNSGVAVLPCPVWDFVFQNNNTTHMANVRTLPNTPFNEAGWAFPSAASAGENDSYVKFNITEPNQPWDFGALGRSAWADQGTQGMPIGAVSTGIIYQHETGFDNGAVAMSSSFTTGYFMIAEGEDFAFVDMIIPDMKWGFFPGTGAAIVQLTFNVVDFPGDTPTAYGPFTVTQTTEYIDVRFRGRQMSVNVASTDSGSFWRLGKIRYRWQPVGRR